MKICRSSNVISNRNKPHNMDTVRKHFCVHHTLPEKRNMAPDISKLNFKPIKKWNKHPRISLCHYYCYCQNLRIYWFDTLHPMSCTAYSLLFGGVVAQLVVQAGPYVSLWSFQMVFHVGNGIRLQLSHWPRGASYSVVLLDVSGVTL